LEEEEINPLLGPVGQVREAVDAFELLVREPEVAEARLHRLAARP
jgi:hypothetical protein